MDFKTFWKESKTAFVIKMLLVAIVLVVIIACIVFSWLRKYTQHGVEVEVPNICGMYAEEAALTLQTVGLQMQVIDSTYSNKVALGTIVEQDPTTGSKVKKDRSIYVITNARARKKVPLPDLHDVSSRQAQATLRALELQIDSIRYEPSEYRDLVLDVQLNGRSVEPGESLQEGSAVVLVVGRGSGTEMVYVPSLIGKTLAEARDMLLQTGLIVGATAYDTPHISADSVYLIYEQSPNAKEWIMEGSHVDLSLSTDLKKAQKHQREDTDEEFF